MAKYATSIASFLTIFYCTYCIFVYPPSSMQFQNAAYFNGGAVATLFALFEGLRMITEWMEARANRKKAGAKP